MFPIYEEQRTKLAKDMNDSVQTIMSRAKQSVEWATKHAIDQNAYLTKVTEDYIAKGYFEGTNDWRRCGEFRTSRYVKTLAKNMGRPFVSLKFDPGTIGELVPGGYIYTQYKRHTLCFPNTIKCAPLYAHLDLVAQERLQPANQRALTTYVLRDREIKGRRRYHLFSHGPSGSARYNTYDDSPILDHPLVTHFILRAASGPVYRSLLKIS